MTLSAHKAGGFLTIETHSAEGPACADAIERLRADEIDALILADVVPAAALPVLVDQLETNGPAFVVTDFPGPFRSFFYGMNVNLSPPDLTEYYAQEPRFAAALERLSVAAGLDLVERAASALSRFDRGRPYVAAPGPEPDQRHFFATFRGHKTGGYIPAHFDNEQAKRPSYRFLAPQIRSDIFSYVLTLAEAEAGGQLELFNLRADTHADAFKNVDGGRGSIDVDSLERAAIAVPAGSMVLVNSGRMLHRVTPVQGPRTRWTLCSFMALARGGDKVLCWG